MEIPLPLPESNTILNFLKSLNPDHARYKRSSTSER